MHRLSEARVVDTISLIYKIFLFVVFLVLAVRLVELQVVKGAYFRSLSEDNRIRRVTISAPRGNIIARGGELLATSRPVRKRIYVGDDGVVRKTTDVSDAAEEEVILEWQREYPFGKVAGHVTGYISEVGEEEVGKVDPDCSLKGVHKLSGYVGRVGLEAQYDCILRGIDGEELIEVDTQGRKIRSLGRREPIRGSDLRTNIDAELLSAVSEIMGSEPGAVVVTDPKGQILALYSSPSYDPTIFVPNQAEDGKTDADELQTIFNDKSLPLFNRAIGGLYHPGSIFKIVTAVAGLEEGEIDASYRYNDEGVIRIDKFSYFNWYFTQYGRTEGEIGLVRALARSTDTFFYKVGELLGADRLAHWAKRFGLEETTGIDLPGEIASLVPDPQWKKRVKGENWFLGNTYHMSIGQGDLAVTPLAANRFASVIASGGLLCRPIISSELKPECLDLEITQENIDQVEEGMIGACKPGGTASPFFDFQPQVACKTGTAETEREGETHAWLTAYAPVENPEIVVTLLVEKGGEGSSVAAPKVREILDFWFHRGRNE